MSREESGFPFFKLLALLGGLYGAVHYLEIPIPNEIENVLAYFADDQDREDSMAAMAEDEDDEFYTTMMFD